MNFSFELVFNITLNRTIDNEYWWQPCDELLETLFSLSTDREIFKHPRQATQQSTQQTTKPNLN